MISKYKLNARVYPALIALLPLLLVGAYLSVDFQNWYAFVGSIGLIAVLQFLLGELGRDRGKKIEEQLWNDWGGTPSTQILRFSNSIIGEADKKFYHSELLRLTGVGKSNMKRVESASVESSDEIYSSWSSYLRSKTRDIKKYNLLFQENISYGFRRNLLGLKPLASLIAIISLIGVLISEYAKIGLKFTLISQATIFILLGLILIILFWFLVVRKSWVKMVAFAYAERLLEATRTLE